MPEARTELRATIDGTELHLTGSGYHDHNWGNAPMMDLMNHWYWGRAKIGPYVVVSSYIIGQKKYGYGEYPVFMIAKDDEIVADDALNHLQFHVEDRYNDPKTGQLVCGRVVYDYTDGDTSHRITYQREKDLLQERMVNMLPDGLMKIMAKIIRFDGAYHRMAGTALLEKTVHGELVERIETPAIWELMFFGNTPREHRCQPAQTPASRLLVPCGAARPGCRCGLYNRANGLLTHLLDEVRVSE